METKKKIMDSAFRLFADEGSEFSLTEVAIEVGIQKASIYAHFASKEDLLFAVIDREINTYFFEINKCCKNLKNMFFMILSYYKDSKTKLYFWKRLLLFPPKTFEETLVAKINQLSEERYQLAKEIIESDIKNGNIRCQDANAIALSYFSFIHGLLSSSIIYQSEDPSNYYEHIWQIFWNGIV
ncbi:MAG: TetR/AcrR family transcriptional regulator [Clostridia bacterium]|nr:TetR/AcrR family transcriptional regulator [Clostridia bacterium]